MDRYPVDVAELLEELGAQINVSDSVELGELRVGDEEFGVLEPASFDVTLTNTGAGVVAQGRVRVRVQAECCRCLEPFDTIIEGEVEGFYVTPAHAEQIPEEQEFELIEEHTIDLATALFAAIVVEAPFAPLHDEECAGICPTCGADLNRGPCGCPPAQGRSDSPFAALGELLGEAASDEDGGDAGS